MATPRSSHHLVAAAAIAAAGVSYPPPLPPTPHGASSAASAAPHDAGSAGGAARQIVDSLLARFLPLARRRIETAQAQDGQYLRPSDPSYEQVLDSLAMVARHTPLPLLEALLRWRESESPKGAHDASTYQKKEKNHRSMALDCLHRLVKFYVNVYADYQPRNHVWDYLDSVTSQLLTVLNKGLLTQDVQHDKLVLCDLSREEPGFDSLL